MYLRVLPINTKEGLTETSCMMDFPPFFVPTRVSQRNNINHKVFPPKRPPREHLDLDTVVLVGVIKL
jgi:hypothetical protein